MLRAQAKGDTVSEEAERLILDYLRRVADSAKRTLRTDQRIDFVNRLRSRIDELRAGSTDPRQVRKVLDRFGEPSRLVSRERERLEGELAQRETQRREGAAREHADPEHPAGAGGERDLADSPAPAVSAGTDAAEDEPRTQPIPVVRPAADSREGRASGAADPAPPELGRELGREHGMRRAEVAPAGSRGRGTSAGAPEGRDADRGPQPDLPAPVRPDTASSPQARPRHSGPPLYEPYSSRQADQEVPSAVSRLFTHSPPAVRRILRSGVVEGVGLLLVAAGGALQSLPLWFVGALAVSLAIGWSTREKLIGVAPPVPLAVVGAVIPAAVDYGNGAVTYLQALYTYGSGLFRITAVLGAVYLAALLLRRRRTGRGGPSRPTWRHVTPTPGSR